MSQKARREYLKAIKKRYLQASKHNKIKILDEFCTVCGYNRKYAIRLLNRKSKRSKRRPGPQKTYDKAVETVVKRIWLLAEQSCSKILRQILPAWISFYERHYEPLSETVKDKLHTISPATIDRMLKPIRAKNPGKGLCGTRPVKHLKYKIPLKDYSWKPDIPGYFEADTVAHCGDSMEGDFVWSLTFTDILTQWTENRAVWNKGARGVVDKIKDIRHGLPFPLRGVQTDNGSEFLNNHLYRYFTNVKNKVTFTRGRPNKSNDNCRVEQKNWTHVRRLLGYQRIEDPDMVGRIDDLYRTWSLYQNFFQPKQKLICKTRIGSRIVKKYDTPKTPYQRLLESPLAKELDLRGLKETYEILDPIDLKKQIEKKLHYIFAYLR